MKPSFDIIADVTSILESSKNEDSIRFEPTVYAHIQGPGLLNPAKKDVINEIMKRNDCSLDTACMIFSTSWGMYQIMGENIYSVCDYGKNIGWFLGESNGQDQCFALFLKSIGFPDGPDFDDQQDLEIYATRYNGPGDPSDYIKKLLEIYKEEYQ